ncbi:MAG: right-handed parallel beta-helix repeat-containing protein [Kiritimatiellae bacterium]|nr:right-handed parallel beta-helix repeat-containing protein [Kiritimatiellia bacterium]
MSVAVALSAANAWADDSAEEGLWQKKISGSWTTTADPSDGGTLVPGALLASCHAGSYTYEGTTYTMGDSQTWAYSGVMYMVGGVTYRFVKNYDDNGCIIITDPDTDVKTTVILSTSYSETKYGIYTPVNDGYYPIYLAVYNGNGGKGPVSAPFNNASQLAAGLAWNTNGLTSCTTGNYSKWRKFMNTDDDVFLYTEEPAFTIKVLKIPPQFSKFGEIPAPGFVVTNFIDDTSWTFGPGGTTTNETPLDVAYRYGDGFGTVTVSGKPGSELEGETNSCSFIIYRYVKSITSTGNEYIDTGIVPDATTAIEMHYNTTNCADNTVMFGAGAWNGNPSFYFYQSGRYYFRNVNTPVYLSMPYESGIDAFISVSTNASNNIYLNVGGNVKIGTRSQAYTGTGKLNIFATNGGNQKSRLTLYSFKIWQNGELVRDFIPVRTGKTAGLWDCVTSSFFKNPNVDYSFIPGPDLTDIVVDKIPNQFYTGAPLTPSVVVSNYAGTALLVKDVDYTVAYENNIAAGNGRAIVTGIGEYFGVVTNDFAIYSIPAAPAFTAKSYIQHGLMNHWDALDNTGTGSFDPAARVWKDLKGDLDFNLTDKAQWGGDFLEMTGFAGVADGKTGKYLTIELKYRNCKQRRGMPFFSGYAWNRVAWYGNLNQLWLHHRNGETRKAFTGLTAPDAATRDLAVVYGAPGDNYGGDAPMCFYNGGGRLTSGFSNQMVNDGNIPWMTSFTRAAIGAADATHWNFEGRLYSIRLYNCPLSDREIAYNAAVDKVRYDGVDPAEAFNAPDMRWNAASGKVEVLIKVGTVHGAGTLSINGGGTNAWVSVGDEVYIEYKPAPGEKAIEWSDLPDGVPRTANHFIVDFTAEAPVSAKLQLLKEIDLSRALNADPGVEEGSSYLIFSNQWRTFMPVSWNRNAAQVSLGTYSTTSEERGFHYLAPYNGAYFFQSGLALAAGSYTLTLDHYAESAQDHAIYSWRIYDATNGLVCSICSVTNEFRVYGATWHKVQADFTIAKDGIYQLRPVRTATGISANSFSYFDNISITSDTDLHLEVEKCYPYFGEDQARPPVVVRDDNGNILTEGVDYYLVYGANNSVGSTMDYSGNTGQRHGNGYVAARGLGAHYGVAGANFRLGTPIYVKPDGSPSNGGTSWDDAVDFATALTLAAPRHYNTEIWIAGSNVLSTAAVTQYFYGNRIFRGGFKGTESTIEEREEGAYSTIDGDEQFSAVVFTDCANVFFERLCFRGSPSRAISKTDWTGDVHIDDCIFEDNGNAAYVQGVSSKTQTPLYQGTVYVRNSVFNNNLSTNDANGAAALYTYRTMRVSAENSLFSYNAAATTTKVKSSAIFANTSAISLKECDFVGNLAEGSTYGTVYSTGSTARDVIQNCLFLGNRADGANAASLVFSHSSTMKPSDVVNCTFYGNENYADDGCAGVKGVKGIVNIRNSIFYENRVDFADHADCPFDVDFTLLGDDTGATYSFVNSASKLGNSMVYGDPLFVAPGDAHLLSEAGYFDSEGHLYYAEPGERSPAIDAGDPYCDFSRESSPNGSCINLGRYGNTEQASRTPVSGPDVDGIPQVWILWNDPDGYSMPTVSFMMGGNGSYATRGIVYVSTDGGETWEDVSGVVGGLVNGQPKDVLVPHYYIPGSTLMAKVELIGARQTSGPAVASVVVRGTLPPAYGKKGPNNVIHVNPEAKGNNDGTSWLDAFTTWSDALDEASAVKNEIWVAGTNLVKEAMSTKAFAFPVTVRGGFTGLECAASERPAGLRSVIDGQNKFDTFNFNNTGSMTIESIEFLRGGYRGLKKTASAGDITISNCVFYGCTRGLGNWDGNGNSNISYQYGGGGAGLYGSGSAKAKVVDCHFEANIINSAGGNGGFGGGLYVGSFGGGAEIYRCSFVTNYMQRNMDSSAASMSALHVYNTRATVDGCSFYGHYSDGIADVRGSCSGSIFRHCIFVGNYGGRIGVLQVNLSNTNDTTRIENCTFAYNLGSINPALMCTKGAVAVTNCIFYGNLTRINATAAVDIRVAADASATVDYCLFTVPEEDGSTICVSATQTNALQIGTHCVYGDPLLVTPIETVLFDVNAPPEQETPRSMTSGWNWSWSNPFPKFETRISYKVHLRGGLGYFDEKTGARVIDYRESELSPAVDAGDPNSDYSMEPDTNSGWHGKRVNLGAYGNTPWATLTRYPGAAVYLR